MANGLYILALMAVFAILVEATFLVPGKQRTSYCNLKTCEKRRHSLCLYPLSRPRVQCGKIESCSLTDDEIEEIVEVHNKHNHSGQTPLQWDDELAKTAQAWANQCQFTVDECRNVKRFNVAQSFFYTKKNGPYVSGMGSLVNLNEVIKGTKLFGCGAVRFNPDMKFNTTLLVCNYADPQYSP